MRSPISLMIGPSSRSFFIDSERESGGGSGRQVNFDCFDSETESGLQRSATIKQPSMTQALADPGITGSGKPPAEGNGAGTVRTMFPVKTMFPARLITVQPRPVLPLQEGSRGRGEGRTYCGFQSHLGGWGRAVPAPPGTASSPSSSAGRRGGQGLGGCVGETPLWQRALWRGRGVGDASGLRLQKHRPPAPHS